MNTNMLETKPFNGKCTGGKREIIIYGAGVYGEIAFQGLKIYGITPSYYCDRGRAGELLNGIPVIKPEKLMEHTNADIIIASYNYFYEMIRTCKKYGCANCYDLSEILQLPFEEEQLSGRAIGRIKDIDGYMEMLRHPQMEDEININHIDFVICENCTLNCKNCSNLMPYYAHPQILNDDIYMAALETFIEAVDYIGEIYLIGGEPFINKKIPDIIERFAVNSKVGGISIFSNGTIVPEEHTLQVMQKYGVSVQISDYGNSLQKLNEISEVLDRYQVNHAIKKYDTWIDLGDFEKRESEIQVKTNYQNCFFRKNYTMHRGKLFRCPRAAHGSYLKLLETDSNESIDFTNMNTRDRESIRQELRQFFEAEYTPMACSYCNGGNLYGETIPAAIQKER